MLMQNATGCFCAGQKCASQVWGEPRVISVPRSKFLEWGNAYLRWLGRHLKKKDILSVKDAWLRSIAFQDTPARSIRKACSLKCSRERLTVMRGGRLTADPLRMPVMLG